MGTVRSQRLGPTRSEECGARRPMYHASSLGSIARSQAVEATARLWDGRAGVDGHHHRPADVIGRVCRAQLAEADAIAPARQDFPHTVESRRGDLPSSVAPQSSRPVHVGLSPTLTDSKVAVQIFTTVAPQAQAATSASLRQQR
jgi:hypothetical protein